MKISKRVLKILIENFLYEENKIIDFTDEEKKIFIKSFNKGKEKAFKYFSGTSGSRLGKYSKSLDNLAKKYSIDDKRKKEFLSVLQNHINNVKVKFVSAKSFKDLSAFHDHGTDFQAYLEINPDKGNEENFGVFNPTVIFVKEHIKDKFSKPDVEKSLSSISFHEITHIETRMADFLRKNLKKSKESQVSEKELKKIMLSHKKIVEKMKKSATSDKVYYNSVKKRYGKNWQSLINTYGKPSTSLDPRLTLNASDEIRDRISELKADADFNGNFELSILKAKEKNYDEIKKLYGEGPAYFLMFIDYENNNIVDIIDILEKIA